MPVRADSAYFVHHVWIMTGGPASPSTVDGWRIFDVRARFVRSDGRRTAAPGEPAAAVTTRPTRTVKDGRPSDFGRAGPPPHRYRTASSRTRRRVHASSPAQWHAP